ncbi:Ig-like protein group 2 [Paenibacillus cellulosilyticus]|uniref:Ig-like protein group 2 n=1 Tax=Paenibacillus cellulosilyticus TaxID=375489 RepID=A0A2V2YNF0_9BACL|nr:S-layer homology domain-containing protein [Paenibacillus cellulosilyticus]PWV97350.1 Ig-like protein group 2 [Paenibacillus cellulosilyticus]
MNKRSLLAPWKLLLSLALLATSLTWATASTPYAQAATTIDVQQATANRTKQDIVDRWMQYRPLEPGTSYMSEDQIYEVAPSLKPPYAAGTLKSKYIEDGINAANFVRYLAGLPDDLTPDWSLQQQQQTAALVNAINNQLSHYPTQPANMEQSMFELGSEGTSSSNLYMGSPTFYDNVLGYMSDSDSSNIERVGHRRWVLNPSMTKTMFGMVFSHDANWNAPYASMYAFNMDRSESDVSYDYVAWPSAGYFPSEVFAPYDAWSVSLNPKRFDNERTSEIQVQLTRARDGKQWTFTSADRDKSGRFFNVETSGRGIPFAVIFRPDNLGTILPEDTFNVTISGIYRTSGQADTVSFQTNFFNLLPDLATAQNAIHLNKGETVKLRMNEGAQTSGNVFVSSDPSVVTIDSQGRVTGVGEGEAYISIDDYLGNQSELYVAVGKSTERVSSWALDGYTKAKGNGLIGLYNDHSYQQPITRSSFTDLAVQMLENIQGSSLANNVNLDDSPFTDVYNYSVIWAAQNGIIQGTSSTTFSPNAPITREQAATLLLKVYDKALEIKAALTAGSSVSQSIPTSSAVFADDSRIASWARSSVYQAVGLKLMNGTGSNQFTPKGNLTYEQTFLIMENVFELVMG